MNQSPERKKQSHEWTEEDEPTERIVPLQEQVIDYTVYKKQPISSDTSNRENTDPSIRTINLAENTPHSASLALAESGKDTTSALNTRVGEVTGAHYARLLREAMETVRLKVEAGRDPNILLEQLMHEQDELNDELEALEFETDTHDKSGDQQTMIKDTQARQSRLATQINWLRGHLDQIQ